MSEKLLKGVVEFRRSDFEDHRKLFESLGRSQAPHTLFIGCSDSRVIPSLITKTLAGELFVVRNVGNIVPMYKESCEHLATTSAVEYAVQVLNVENIVVCGHSNCAGCAALYAPEEALRKIPHTKKWLELSSKVRKQVLETLLPKDDAEREWMTEQLNVVEQMKHLLTYPYIREKYDKKQIAIYGWHYIIETGEIYKYDPDKGVFELIT
jgi:carbonic anhydrase